MSAKTECDYCGAKCCGDVKLTEDGFGGEWTLDFCRLTCLLDYLLEKRYSELEWGRKIEANLELGLDSCGYLPALREAREQKRLAS